MPARHLRAAALALILVLAAATLSACGGKNASAGDATSLIKQTFGGNHPIHSGRADVTLNVDLQGLTQLNGPLNLHLSGPFQGNGPKAMPDFAFDLDLESGPRPVTLGTVFAGGAGYLTIEGQAFDLGPDFYNRFKQGWLRAKADSAAGKGGVSLATLGVDPIRWLRNPQNKGSEDIAGTETEHVAAQVDVPRLLDDLSTLLSKARGVTGGAGGAAASLPTQLTAQQRQEIQRSVKLATLDVWTGKKDHTLRRINLEVQLAVPQDLQAQVGGLRGGHIALDATLADLNQPQKIVKPVGAKPASELTAALQQLGLTSAGSGSGGSGSGDSGSGGSGSSGAAAAPATGAQADYAKCLQAAGEDLAKVQKCASLLR